MNSKVGKHHHLLHGHIRSITPAIIVSFLLIGTPFFVGLQIGEAQVGVPHIFSTDQIAPTFIVSIVPGAAFPDSQFHYYPQDIAVPVGTAIGWFNDDPGQPHTVTSGTPDDTANSGTLFNSGIMPLGSSFQYSFDEPGTFEYYCTIHPWRVATVTVGGAIERGSNFELRSGTGPILDLTQHNRTVLEFRPFTFSPQADPIIYNVSLVAPNATEIISESFIATSFFVRADNNLYLELVNDASMNRTSVYGPDVWDPVTGTYHIAGNLFEAAGEYIVGVEVTSIGDTPPADRIADEFMIQVETQPTNSTASQ
jgi:plastocyanin